jgi:transcriptional regulator NrdR family protein
MKITKRNGNTTMYDDEKVVNSILKANQDISGEEITRAVAVNIADKVFSRLTKENEIIATKDVRDCVYEILTERNYTKTAKAYAEYKK